MDEMFLRTQQQQSAAARNGEAPPPTMASLVSPQRNGSRLLQTTATTSQDARSGLPRRFTTDSGHVPTLGTLAGARGPVDASAYGNAGADPTLHKYQMLEKKRRDYENLRRQRQKFEEEMLRIEQQQRREEHEINAMQEDLRQTGHLSEPTTPPEYRETAASAGFPSLFSSRPPNPNRYSTSNLMSSPGAFTLGGNPLTAAATAATTTTTNGTRGGRSSSQLASPAPGLVSQRSSQAFSSFDDGLPVRSGPVSRRNSEEDDKEEAVRQDPTSHRATNAVNRYSMPVTKSKRGFYDTNFDQSSIDPANTAGFLFGDDDAKSSADPPASTTSDAAFAAFARGQDYTTLFTGSSAALDLATAQPSATSTTNGFGSIGQHRTRQSISLIGNRPMNNNVTTPTHSSKSTDTHPLAPRANSSVRNSIDLAYLEGQSTPSASSMAPNTPSRAQGTAPKLPHSYSASDVSNKGPMTMSPNSHAEAHFLQHNANLGRIPVGAANARHNRDMSGDVGHREATVGNYSSIQSALHGNAAPFPGISQPSTHQNLAVNMPAGTPLALSQAQMAGHNAMGMHQMPQGPFANFYPQANPQPSTHTYANGGVNQLTMGMHNMNLVPYHNGPQGYPAFDNAGFQNGGRNRHGNGQVVRMGRNGGESDAMSRFNGRSLQQFTGQILELAKDQYGCRYLQKQIEAGTPEEITLVWQEVRDHISELMMDPFGNYLSQKLFELCNNEQRTALARNASPKMVAIAHNQHGTRALQKMIEFMTTIDQIQIVIDSLRFHVVELIKDLNGNHVIQKCLNKLGSHNCQFIFDAVGATALHVGSHRHGCCVLQRCIDHADETQRPWLIERITNESFQLVQDPFGNYVVQYIIDLNNPNYTMAIIERLNGQICNLSRHKFSSNVIEKLLRCANVDGQDAIVNELLANGEMERNLSDSYANYVIQTAIDNAHTQLRFRLVDAIRPLLHKIRNTPYGRRIGGKISQFDGGQFKENQNPQQTTVAVPSLMGAAHFGGLPTNQAPAGLGIAPPVYGMPHQGPPAFGINGAHMAYQTAFPQNVVPTQVAPAPAQSNGADSAAANHGSRAIGAVGTLPGADGNSATAQGSGATNGGNPEWV